jgi:2-(1,2-epoxy-1,2-dihydrophenyl)acetyl-CoA isomerase
MLGLRRALRFALLGEVLDAQRALSWGLVSEVVPAAELDATVARWSAQVAASAPLALGAIKQLLRGALDHPLDEHLIAEGKAFQECARSEDFKEGCEAFLAKRRPRFEGR